MERRNFLRRSALLGGGVAGVVAGAEAVGLSRSRDAMAQVKLSGYAVGGEIPPRIGVSLLVWQVAVTERVAALTFDDGPDPRYTPAVLDALARAGARATFFMMGRNAAAFPSLVRRVAAHHEVGNHSWSHPDLSLASAAQAREELGRTHDFLTTTLGHAPTLFRPPYGRMSGAVSMVAAGHGYDTVLWSDRFESYDTSRQNVDRLSPAIGPGSIVLGHDGGTLPNQVLVAALPELLANLRARTIELVTVGELLDLAWPDRRRQRP